MASPGHRDNILNRAITHVEKVYTIDPDKCKECQGTYDSPMCAQLCNTDACVPA